MPQKKANSLQLTKVERQRLYQAQQKAAENLDIQALEDSFSLMGGYRSFLRDAWGYMDYEKLNENTIWFYHFLTTLPDYETFATQSISLGRAEYRLFQIVLKDEKLLDKMLNTKELKAIFDNGINMNAHIRNFIQPDVLDKLYQNGHIRYDQHFLQALLEVDEKSEEELKRGRSPFINGIAYLDYALDKKVDLSVLTQEEWNKFYQRRMIYMSLPFMDKLYAYCPEIKAKKLSDLTDNIYSQMAKMQIEKITYLLDTHEHTVNDIVQIASNWLNDMKDHHKPRFMVLVQRLQEENSDALKIFVEQLQSYPGAYDPQVQYEFRKLLGSIALYDKLSGELPENENTNKGFKI